MSYIKRAAQAPTDLAEEAKIIFCPVFFETIPLPDQAETFYHEVSHLAGTQDHGYYDGRSYYLRGDNGQRYQVSPSVDELLNNADTYSEILVQPFLRRALRVRH